MSRSHFSGLRFVIVFGIVSFFSDATHEGARSILGPFLGSLGVGATGVGFIAGFGEMAGFGLRLLSGRWADRSKRYWLIMGIGYSLNLLSVPLLAWAGTWWLAAGLIVMERAGRAIRNPARDVLLSNAATGVGRGWGFGVHEALDQAGATLGPLAVMGILALGGSWRTAFGWLIVPAVCALVVLGLLRSRYPAPKAELPVEGARPETAARFPRAYWLYLTGSSLVAAGFVDYPLMAFHWEHTGVWSGTTTALLYALAMAVDALAALGLGKWYDRQGIPVMAWATGIALLFAPAAFSSSPVFAVVGTVLWGIGMGAQESIMRAAVADLAPLERRGTAYGTFNFVYGVAWFAGSALFGILYDRSVVAAVVFSMALQIAAIPLFLLTRNRRA